MQERKNMATHNELGKEGEKEAEHYLREKGYTILHRNWRSGKYELDLIARFNNELVVIEVKTRRNTLYGMPETVVDERKIRRIISSTNAYLHKYQIDLPVRFDIITIIGTSTPFEIQHIEDAFYPPIW